VRASFWPAVKNGEEGSENGKKHVEMRYKVKKTVITVLKE